MFKSGIINPEINYHVSKMAHHDTMMISDAAMELPGTYQSCGSGIYSWGPGDHHSGKRYAGRMYHREGVYG